MPYPEIGDEDPNSFEVSPPKPQIVHVRLHPLMWEWIRYVARKSGCLPAAWIRTAMDEYNNEGGIQERIREKVLHVRVSHEEWRRARKMADRAGVAPAAWIRRACNRKLIGE